MQSILLFMFVIVLLSQLVLAFFAWQFKKNLSRKYFYPLASQTEVSVVLEKFFNKFKDVNIRASDEIDQVAYYYENVLYIHRNALHSRDLYSVFFVLFQVNLSLPQNRKSSRIGMIQSVLFFFQIFTFILALFVPNVFTIFIIFSLIIQALLFLLTIYWLSLVDQILKDTLVMSLEFFPIDAVEQSRMVALAEEIKYYVFEYPLNLIWKILQFFR